MKKLLLLLILCVVYSGPLLAQQQKNALTHNEFISINNMSKSASATRNSPTHFVPIDSTHYYEWDVIANNWKLQSRSTDYSYSGKNLLSVQYHQITDSGWINVDKIITTYDINNNIIDQTNQVWNVKKWCNSNRTISTYYTSTLINSRISQTWKDTIWINNSQLSYTYDAHNNLAVALSQDWQDTAWLSVSKITHAYNTSNNIVNRLYEIRKGNVWINAQKDFFTYDDGNHQLQTMFLTQTWKGTLWVNNSQFIYTYDINNKQTCSLGQYWQDSVWNNVYKDTYAYDANGNFLSELNTAWEEAWINVRLLINTYDKYNNKISIATMQWNADNATWINVDSVYYYFTPEPAAVKNKINTSSNLIVYPNPFLSGTTILFNNEQKNITINLIDLYGKTVKNLLFTGKAFFLEREGLKSGIYFLQISTTDGRLENCKIVIQ